MYEEDQIYLDQTPQHHVAAIEKMTTSKDWNYERFKLVMISLAIAGKGVHIPARNRPDSIRLSGFGEYTDRLVSLTQQRGIEYSQVVLVDTKNRTLVSGKIVDGNENSVELDYTQQPGREDVQRVVGTFHTHPYSMYANGLSDTDYVTFLSNKDHQFMMIAYGSNNRIFVMKTSVTPNNLSQKSIERRIKDAMADYFELSEKHPYLQVVDFNKSVCSELGLTMYLANNENSDLFTRVNVVE